MVTLFEISLSQGHVGIIEDSAIKMHSVAEAKQHVENDGFHSIQPADEIDGFKFEGAEQLYSCLSATGGTNYFAIRF